MELIPRFFEPPTRSFFLFGPRGTGKSRLLGLLYPDALWLDFLRTDVLRAYLARPERIEELAASRSGPRVVVVDELQKAPAILPVVHRLIEGDPELRFVLTGSSSRSLKRSGVDLLGGRALRCTLHPFMAAELGERFDLRQALETGLVPLVLAADEPRAVIRGYADLYIQEEVKAEGLVRNLGDFTRFLEAAALTHASLLNVSNVARECQVERKTVQGYFEILEDLLLTFRLDVFNRRARRETVAHPKLYFFDAGVFRSLRPRGPLDRVEEFEGAALEGLVIQHLRAWNAYRGERNSLHFWRTRSGTEVDAVLYGEDGLWAIEVKNGSTIHPQDTRPLRSFLADYPEARAVLVYRGSERLRLGPILCVPAEEFLRGLDPGESGLVE